MFLYNVISSTDMSFVLDVNRVALEGIPQNVSLEEISQQFADATNIFDFRHEHVSRGYVKATLNVSSSHWVKTW